MSEVTLWQKNEMILDMPASHWLEHFRELAYTEKGQRGNRARLIYDFLQKKIDLGEEVRKNFVRNLE